MSKWRFGLSRLSTLWAWAWVDANPSWPSAMASTQLSESPVATTLTSLGFHKAGLREKLATVRY